MTYLQLDLTQKQSIQEKFIQYSQALLNQDPRLETPIGWENKQDILAWLDTLLSGSAPSVEHPQVCSCFSCSRETNEINYQGEKIKLSRSYNDYDEYKNDPINIDPSEIERVQQLVINAPIARSFQNRLQASTAIGQIAFPGYGSGGFVAQQQTDGSVLMGFSVEIPNAGKERYFVFLENNGECTLIDDFVFSDALGLINSVVLRGDNLIFSSIEGKEILVRSYLGKK